MLKAEEATNVDCSSSAKSDENLVEYSEHQENNSEVSEHKILGNIDEGKAKENYNRSNVSKQVCWFYTNNNYCRFGRNCRFSHIRKNSAEHFNRRTAVSRDEVSSSRSRSNAQNLTENDSVQEMPLKESMARHQHVNNSGQVQKKYPKRYDNNISKNVQPSTYSDNHHLGRSNAQNLTENDNVQEMPLNESMARHQHLKNYGQVQKKYPKRYDNNISKNMQPSTYSDNHHSNVQTLLGSNAIRKQRNLYFYRTNRNAAPHSPGTGTQSVNRCRYFLKGFCRLGDDCRFLHEASHTTAEVDLKSMAKTVALESELPTSKICNRLELQNCDNTPKSKREVNLQDVAQSDIQKLRDTEIQQLKKRFPGHESIKDSTEETLHITFCPSDPDWSFAVNSVPLEIIFSMEYPKEACTIKVLEDDNLPPVLIWHLNRSISEWIKEKHNASLASGKIELIFRPFLRWLDRNLEKLFIVGLRKVKQDLLAKEAGIEFVPYEDLPGASCKVSAVTHPMDAEDFHKQDTDISAYQESTYVALNDKGEQSSELKSVDQMKHQDDWAQECGSNQETVVRAINLSKEYSSGSVGKENLSPDPLYVKASPSIESKSFISKSICGDKFSVPKLGTEIKLLGLEMRESVATMLCTKIAATLQCGRCKTRHEIGTPAKRNNSLNCIKCHQSMNVVFQNAILHQFSAVLGYLHLVDCQAVDIPLMECNFAIDCLNCSKQISLDGIHYGQLKVTWCYFCNKKLSIYAQAVKFQNLQPAPSIASSGNKLSTIAKKEKKIVKDPAIQEGKPLPDCGTCRHYKKSYRWLRFPCCGKAYPCDSCHDEKEGDHEMKYANRMICGFCAKEQPYSGDKPCISCSSNMTKKSGTHWEGGRGCRDKITMSREDRQKYAGMNKTISKKSQSQKPNKKG